MTRVEKAVEAFRDAVTASGSGCITSRLLSELGNCYPDGIRHGMTVDQAKEFLIAMPKVSRNYLVEQLEAYTALKKEADASARPRFAFA